MTWSQEAKLDRSGGDSGYPMTFHPNHNNVFSMPYLKARGSLRVCAMRDIGPIGKNGRNRMG
jgi:hypothetical protein